jgi:hypothetical protein
LDKILQLLNETQSQEQVMQSEYVASAAREQHATTAMESSVLTRMSTAETDQQTLLNNQTATLELEEAER